MSAEIFEDTLDIDADMVEPVRLDPSNPATLACYPYPLLQATGESQRVPLRRVILRNEWVEVGIAPDLGGRIISLIDRRTHAEAIPTPTGIRVVPGGLRAVEWDYGIQFQIGPGGRANSLGPVEMQIQESEDSVLLHELIPGLGVSWQAKVSMPQNSPRVQIDCSVFNRSLATNVFEWGISGVLEGAQPVPEGGLYDEARNAGFSMSPEKGVLSVAVESPGRTSWTFPSRPWMPRERADHRISLSPMSGMHTPTFAGRDLAFSLQDGFLQLLAHRQTADARVYLLLESGETLESKLDLDAGLIFDLAIPLETSIVGVAIENARKETMAHWQLERQEPSWSQPLRSSAAEVAASIAESGTAEFAYREAVNSLPPHDKSEVLFRQGAQSPPLRSAAHVGLSMAMLARGAPQEAGEQLETALLHNAEDHLAWWLKAVAERLQGQDDDERPDLLNAHFLSPMEPSLRAESFLSQAEHGADPSPVIAPLSENPEAMTEVACLLLEAGLSGECARWIDECLRHREVPMLRYLQAWSLLQNSRMAVEAAEQVSVAGKSPLEPPFPWRGMEKRAIKALAERFSNDERLQSLDTLLSAAQPNTC